MMEVPIIKKPVQVHGFALLINGLYDRNSVMKELIHFLLKLTKRHLSLTAYKAVHLAVGHYLFFLY